MASGSHETIRRYYEQVYRRATDEIYGNLEGLKTHKRRDIWNLHFHENRRDDDGSFGGNGKERFQINEAGNNEYSGRGSEKTLKKRSYAGLEYFSAVKSGDMKSICL